MVNGTLISCIINAADTVPYWPFLKTQIIQTIQSPIATIVGQTFKDSNGICWSYLGQFDYNYIPTIGYQSITYNGNYFASAFPTTYIDCEDCVTSPL